jgi:hypothetical protein
MILTGKKRSTLRKSGLGVNLGFRGVRPATNRLRHALLRLRSSSSRTQLAILESTRSSVGKCVWCSTLVVGGSSGCSRE